MAKLVSADLKFSASQIKRAMQPAIVAQLNDIINRTWYQINEQARDIIDEEIRDTSEYRSLIEDTGHSLKAEFGIEDAESKLNEIIDTWVRGVRVTLKPVRFGGNRLVGGISIQAIDSSYKDVINLPEAHHDGYSKAAGEAYDIRWLEWLLLEGSDPQIYYFYVDDEWDPAQYESRTGLAVMKRGSASTVWRVPEWAAGYPGDNWITRAMAVASDKIQSLIVATISLRTPNNVVLTRPANTRVRE